MNKAFLVALLMITVSFAQESATDPKALFLIRCDTPIETTGIALVEKNLAEASGTIAADYMNFIDFPSYLAIGAAGSEDLAYSSGLYVASQLASKGVRVLYGLRFDSITSKDTSIGVRGFGSDDDLVCRLAKSFARGVRDGGLRCIGILTNATEERVKCAVESGVDGLVLKDAGAIDTIRASGFNGAVITPLISEGVEQGVRDALMAGYDMVQIRSADIESATSGANRALGDGANIQRALERANAVRGEITAKAKADDGTPIRVARRAVSLVVGGGAPVPQNASVGIITDNEKLVSEIRTLRENVSFYSYDSYETKDVLVLCVEGDRGRTLIPELAADMGKKLIVLSLGFPMDVFYYPEIRNYITTYGNDSSSLRAAAETLFGSNTPTGSFPLKAPRTKITDINYATEGKKDLKALEGSSDGAILFNADYYTEKRMVRVGLHPGSAAVLTANATVGASFPSPVKNGSLTMQVEFSGGIRGTIDNALTSGSFEVIAGVIDLTTNETYGTQVLYRNMTKEVINQSYTATLNVTFAQGHRYLAYIETRAKQDATLLLTGKIDFWTNDYGVWYDRITIWV